MKTSTDISLVIEAEGVSVEEVRRDIEAYLKSRAGHTYPQYSDVYFHSVKVIVSRTEKIRDWGLPSDREAHYTINGYPPDDDVSIDDLIGGNS